MLAQALGALLLRPAPGSKLRKVWNLWHWWVGRLVLAAGIGQFFFGLWIVGNPALYYIVPAAIIALWCIVAFVKVRCSSHAIALQSLARQPPPARVSLGPRPWVPWPH
jgi:hypothetical protein